MLALLVLVAAPTLLTRAEIEVAPVEQLSLTQLEVEYDRVKEPRNIWPASMLLILGTALSAVAVASAIGALASSNDLTPLIAFSIISLCTGTVGGTSGLIGGLLMPFLAWRHDRWAERREAVLARLQAVRDGGATAPPDGPPQLNAEIWELESKRPGLVTPIGIMVTGAVVLAIGLAAFTGSNRELPISCTVAGLAALGSGAAYLFSDLQEREEIDARMAGLRAPPPVPVSLRYYWHF